MNSPAYPILGLDPDAFCTPELRDLQSIPLMKRGWLVADYARAAVLDSHDWKKCVASLALKRCKNKKITEMQKQRILAWLERNRADYPMLPPGNDPRFARVDSEWQNQWGWPRNACAYLNQGVAAVVSLKEPSPMWEGNPKWRQLDLGKSILDCVPELDEDERLWHVCRNADSLASLVAHPICFGDVLKMIDPYADYERWHPTLDAMLRFANPGISIELHCSRKIAVGKGADGPSTSFRRAWETWAQNQPSGKMIRLSVYFWEELRPAAVELHDRHVIIGATTSKGAIPFAGVSVGKGWDQAPPHERHLTTSYSLMSRKDQEIHWKNYSTRTIAFNRHTSEDVHWIKSSE